MKAYLKAIIAYIRDLLYKIFKKYHKQLPYIITAVVAAIIAIGAIDLFSELTEDLKSKYLQSYDSSISEAVIGYRSPSLTEYFTFMTHLGNIWVYVGAFILFTLLFYWKFKSWKYVLQMALVMILALSSNYILKQWIDRARPETEHLATFSTASYPSGHAMISMAFYGFLIYAISTLKISKTLKGTWILICVFLILNIGISRIYLGVHFPSDIAGGWIAGFFWVIFCVMIFNLILVFRRDPKI